jgi:S-formylglutathione hydrolase
VHGGYRVSCVPSFPFPFSHLGTSAQKGGFFKDAAAQGIAVVFTDTSPRGAGIDGEDDDWDFGTGAYRRPTFTTHVRTEKLSGGAGFYLNATTSKFSKHYNMLEHITVELPKAIEAAGLPIVGINVHYNSSRL